LSYTLDNNRLFELILRRAPADTKAKGAHDMGREFHLQAALKPVYAYVPEMLAFCDDQHIIGTDFYIMQKLNGMLTRREVIDYYLSKTGLKVENFAFYEVYGLFRLAAIAQQIYYRYHHNQTQNSAFKHIWFFVHYLLWQCRKAIKGQG
jgi:aminoglycoside phosphotransferase (APT) family kinase protein